MVDGCPWCGGAKECREHGGNVRVDIHGVHPPAVDALLIATQVTEGLCAGSKLTRKHLTVYGVTIVDSGEIQRAGIYTT